MPMAKKPDSRDEAISSIAGKSLTIKVKMG